MGSKAVICAMQKELDILSAALYSSGDVRSALSGIGKVNAALATAALIRESRPDAVISIGCAGSFAEGVGVGDIIIASETAYHDVWCGPGNEPGQVQGLPASFGADPMLLACASSLSDSAKVHCGLICTGDRFIETIEEDRKILELFPEALACDMESAAIAQVCYLKHVPFMCFRIVSDCVADGGHDVTYGDFWNNVSDRSFALVEELIKKIPHSL